jgi:hypothetical protein
MNLYHYYNILVHQLCVLTRIRILIDKHYYYLIQQTNKNYLY